MVYGIIELINFAHGDIFTLGAFMSMPLISAFGLSEGQSSGVVVWLLLLVITVIVMVINGGVNVLIERVAYRPLQHASRLAPLITAVGVSFILEGIMYVWRGASNVHYPDLLPDTRIPLIGSTSLGVKDIIVIVTAIVLVVLLTIFIGGTRLGKAMRATAQDRESAQLMGGGINRTILVTSFSRPVLAR